MSERILATPDRLDQLAKQLDDCNTTVGDAATAFTSAVSAALEVWEGKARAKYEAAFHELEPILKSTIPSLIAEMSTEARSRADKYRAADS